MVALRRPGANRRGLRRATGGTAALSPALTSLQNWWRSENLTVGVGGTWTDEGSEGATLTKGFANDPANGIPINGYATLWGNNANAVENASTALAASAAYEVWMVLRAIDFSVQLAYDGVGGTERNTFFVDATGDFNSNAGSTLAYTGAEKFRDGSPMLVRITRDAAGDGALYAITDTGSTLTTPVATGALGTGVWTGITLGANNAGTSGWRGDIAEVLRYTAELSAGDAEQTAAYLLDKYPSLALRAATEALMVSLGDSITLGTGSTDGHGWRLPLHTLIEATPLADGTQLLFRGTVSDRCLDHSGVSGDTIADIEARVAANAAAVAAPAVIVICPAGTNDCQDAGFNLATATAAWESLLAACATSWPDVPVVVSGPPPMTNTTHNANATALRAELVSVFAAATSPTYPVDISTGFDPATMTTDGTHPNDAGYAFIAPLIVGGLREALA